MKRISLIGCILLSSVSLIAQTGAKNGEWRSYGADVGNTHYSPLDQINASNFNKLEPAWHFKTDNLVLRREGRCHRGRSPPLGRSTPGQEECEGLRPGIRRAYRQASLDLPYHPAA